MKGNFGALLWSSFMQIYGPIVSVLSVICSFLFWYFLPTKSISLVYVVIIAWITAIIILTLGQAAYKSYQLNKIELPRIINSKRDQRGNIICVLEQSILFSFGIFVSFYYIDDGDFEILIGTGKVILIQRDGKIQVVLDHPVSGYEEILDGFGNNNQSIKERIYIKPTIIGMQ